MGFSGLSMESRTIASSGLVPRAKVTWTVGRSTTANSGRLCGSSTNLGTIGRRLDLGCGEHAVTHDRCPEGVKNAEMPGCAVPEQIRSRPVQGFPLPARGSNVLHVTVEGKVLLFSQRRRRRRPGGEAPAPGQAAKPSSNGQR